ncbi:hypothetical protein OIU74_025170 [Salix koriyanagi]|uniref:EMC1 first beta-propeller domain-containing protein n=1 Tax=Salix koriyanagi TaxID=2511006 RepID=A0A9Q0W152_9ROSI|nr:hypothetical protein OIU74_025170 [Salix koriyanagi]
MAMAIRSLLIFLCIQSIAVPTFSLYEDQAGLMDWHQKYIGKVKHAVFQTQKTGRKRVLVSTEENVIASLDLRHGEIFWRHVLGTDDAIDGIDIAMGKYLITLSSEGSILRAWNLPDGQMWWESFLQGSSDSKSFLFVSTSSKVDFPVESFEVQEVIQHHDSNIIYVVGFVGSSQFDVYQINAENGELLKHDSAAFDGGFSGEVSLVSKAKLVVLDAARSTLLTISFQKGEISFQKTYISDLVKGFSGIAMILPSKLTGLFAVKTITATTFISMSSEGQLEVVDKINHATVISDALSFSEDRQAFALVQHGDSNIHLNVKQNHDWSSDLLKERIKLNQQKRICP